MSREKTICGVELERFADKPTPEELGNIVADWSSDQQAHFFICLGEAMRYHCGPRVCTQWQYLAEGLQKMEERILDGSGSELLRELASRLGDR